MQCRKCKGTGNMGQISSLRCDECGGSGELENEFLQARTPERIKDWRKLVEFYIEAAKRTTVVVTAQQQKSAAPCEGDGCPLCALQIPVRKVNYRWAEDHALNTNLAKSYSDLNITDVVLSINPPTGTETINE